MLPALHWSVEREQIAAFPGAVAALSVIGQVLLQFFLRLIDSDRSPLFIAGMDSAEQTPDIFLMKSAAVFHVDLVPSAKTGTSIGTKGDVVHSKSSFLFSQEASFVSEHIRKSIAHVLDVLASCQHIQPLGRDTLLAVVQAGQTTGYGGGGVGVLTQIAC